ncbi:MAG: hypothetical protein MPJ05_06445 [Nitrosopumilus sp.]|nr:hypothetical protein [Nitrosopumilus sp.]MDA7945552.1 hypothetical protein [Nitrosopumilus sp.]MDA7953439.1 hypothetical protein [Nitrosopumilus sp.]MDA7954882.1 hypothetical protein [Nitrosopumilus sp.]MDA7974087.1 hypothetical protein [Nitrosopumilus sp.]
MVLIGREGGLDLNQSHTLMDPPPAPNGRRPADTRYNLLAELDECMYEIKRMLIQR